ncbi:MAG: GDSL-type esterase/lipase family protein [Oscillospiraceae bacterium]
MITIKDNDKILFLGDSITDIAFNKRMRRKIGGAKTYPLVVSNELKKSHKGLEFFYKGIASDRSYLVYDRLTKDCIKLKPDVIVLLIGVNDAWENYVPEEYPPLLRPFDEHMNEIFRRLKAELPNAKLIMMTPFLIDTIEEKKPFHKVLEKYIEKELAFGKAFGAEMIELQKMFDKKAKTVSLADMARDGVHPTNLGHSFIADEVLKILK